MKASAVLLSVSAALVTAASTLNSKVVVPSMRLASDLKEKGLNAVFNEHDREYWKRVDAVVASRKFLKELEQEVKDIEITRRRALNEHKRYQRERTF